MKSALDRPFEVQYLDGDSPDRMHDHIYAGLLDSDLLNASEKRFLTYLITYADIRGMDRINTITISINQLTRDLRMSSSTICKCIRSLSEKGVLVKINRIAEDEGYRSNIYEILNYTSVWDCKTLDELKKETDRIKKEVKCDVSFYFDESYM